MPMTCDSDRDHSNDDDYSELPTIFYADVISEPVGDPADWSGAYAEVVPENPNVSNKFALNAALGLHLERGGRYVCVKALAPNEDEGDVYITAIARVDAYNTQELQAKYPPDPFDEPQTQTAC